MLKFVTLTVRMTKEVHYNAFYFICIIINDVHMWAVEMLGTAKIQS